MEARAISFGPFHLRHSSGLQPQPETPKSRI
jgi:hypothetical protein